MANSTRRKSPSKSTDEMIAEMQLDGSEVVRHDGEILHWSVMLPGGRWLRAGYCSPSVRALYAAWRVADTGRYLTAEILAFAGQTSPLPHSVRVGVDGAVRVWDSVAGHYTQCHSISETDQARIREAVAAGKQVI